MKIDPNQEKIYIPLIKDFKSQTENIYKNIWLERKSDLSGLFIPHVFDNYYDSNIKIFYIGQDTYEWLGFENLYKVSEKDYLKKNNYWPQSIDEILKCNNPYTFWNFVSKLHLALNGEKYDSFQKLSNQQKNILNQLGWGNIYSLEIPTTIRKYGEDFCNSFDKYAYSELLEGSKNISKLKNVINTFKPDYVVILCWKYVENWYLDGLGAEFVEEESIANLLCVYKLKYSNTKILWTYHPQALCRKSQDLNELIKKMIEVL